MRHYIAVAVSISFFLVPWVADRFPDQADRFVAYLQGWGSQLAAVISHNPRTVSSLREKYDTNKKPQDPKIRVLIMPGHEPGYGGAEYRDIYERELNVQLARELAGFLATNSKYEAIVARDDVSWSPDLREYFRDAWDSIIEWQKAHKEESLRRVSDFSDTFVPSVQHNPAPSNIAYRLYGITKWSNENNIDIAVHIHFNDYPGHGYNQPGIYNGFAIYVPEKQYLNSTTTRAVAETVFRRLAKYNAVSDFAGESSGIVDERELIAIGANNTADAASLLIEYAYLYEPQIADSQMRAMAIKDLAYQTYLGLEDFFNPGRTTVASSMYDTLVLPYTWERTITEDGSRRDIFALQTALSADGLYPPTTKSKNDCPRTGSIGPCTQQAIKSFQLKYGLEATGTVGPKTLEKLNSLYSVKVVQ